MRQTIALLVSLVLATSGCASAGAPRVQAAPAPVPRADTSLMASYVTQLPIGSRVRVSLASGHGLSGTLMKADDRAIVVLPRTRIREQPMQIPLDMLASVELETVPSGNAGRSIGIGIAAGAGGALAVFLVLAAIFAGG